MKRTIYYGIILAAFSVFFYGCDEEDETASPVLNLSESSKEIDFQKNVFEVDLMSNTKWELVNKSLWISAVPGSGDGDAKLTFSIAANEENDRKDSVYYEVITGIEKVRKYFVVSQKGVPAEIAISPWGEKNIDENGEEFEVKVYTNKDWSLDLASADEGWISLSRTEGSREDSIVVVTVNSNVGDVHTGTLRFRAGGASVELIVTQEENSCKAEFTYEGEIYKNVKMKDGRCWMAENLRYVPAGMTVSDDPAEDTGIWYAKMESDADSVKAYGYLYNWSTVLGGESAAEKVKGICPPGYHVPSQEELNVLLESYKREDDKVYLEDLEADGFQCTIGGQRMFNGKFTGVLGYMWASTDASTATVSQNKGLMLSPVLKTASVANARWTVGIGLRCVKDEKK